MTTGASEIIDSTGPFVHFVMPLYNEGCHVAEVCEGIAVACRDRSWRIVAVDDGSTDDTAQALRACSERFPGRIDVLTHPRNLGIPEAFFDGFSRVAGRAADDDVMFCVEGDNTSDPSLLPAMIAALEAEADIVVASRHAPGGCYLGFPLRRHFVSALGNATMRVLFPYPGLQDFSIFYRGVRCDLLKSVLRDHGRAAFRGRGFAANASFLLACLLYRPRVREVPHTYRYDNKKSRSTFPVLSTIRAYVELIGSTGVRRLRAACLTAAAENPHSSS